MGNLFDKNQFYDLGFYGICIKSVCLIVGLTWTLSFVCLCVLGVRRPLVCSHVSLPENHPGIH